MKPDPRPVHLDLVRIHLPVGGWVSILHRVSGALLFLGFPASVWLLSTSLAGDAGFARVAAWFASPASKAVVLVVVWALAHHLLAGLRHLALDMHVCVNRRCARASAFAVLSGAGIVTLWAAWRLFA